MNAKFMVSISFTLLFVACAPKTTVVLLDSGKSQNAILVSNEKGETKLDKVGSYVELKDKSNGKILILMLDIIYTIVIKIELIKPLIY